MINAAADDTLDTPAAAASSPAATDDDADATNPDVTNSDAGDLPDSLTPPVTALPWGGTPHHLKLGPTGASSAELRAAGASAARVDNDIEPTPEFAPKGASLRNGVLQSQETNLQPPVPPAPPGRGEPPRNDTDVKYSYAVGKQNAVADGAAGTFTISTPTVGDGDWHSLAEVAVESADAQQIVEVGWTVDKSINGDNDPHLFVFSWVNGGPKCYNECGYVPAKGASIVPGATLVAGVGTTKNFGIQHIGDAWWIAYDTEWIGAFPDTNWTSNEVKFTKSGLVQYFGEVASADTPLCDTWMGNGKQGSGAAFVTVADYVNGPTVNLSVRATTDFYSATKLTSRTFRYGGKGNCPPATPTPPTTGQ